MRSPVPTCSVISSRPTTAGISMARERVAEHEEVRLEDRGEVLRPLLLEVRADLVELVLRALEGAIEPVELVRHGVRGDVVVRDGDFAAVEQEGVPDGDAGRSGNAPE